MPPFVLLKDDDRRARLTTLRSTVAPILAGNLLRPFTDHSVDHSDRLCDLIDQLAKPLTKPLGDEEAFVLYSAAYTHDVGMQHEKADRISRLREAIDAVGHAGRRLAELDEPTKYALLRDHHAAVSAEMVRQALDTPQPNLLGITLVPEDKPGLIAALCEAHTVEYEAEEYGRLTRPAGGVRTSLLSALLRLADILDETSGRAKMYRQLTVDLDLTSQMHWWRHHYVPDVKLDVGDRSITVWFEFPASRHEEYRQVVPGLQLPEIEAELARHRPLLAQEGAHWHLAQPAFFGPGQSSTRVMPDAVHLKMLQELERRRTREEAADLVAAADRLDRLHALVGRQLGVVRDPSVPPAERLRRALDVADQLVACGGRKGATDVLQAARSACREVAGAAELLPVTCRLAELLIDGDQPRWAANLLASGRRDAAGLPVGDPIKLRLLDVLARALLALAEVGDAAEVVRTLREEGADPLTVEALEAELAEALLVAGEVPDAASCEPR